MNLPDYLTRYYTKGEYPFVSLNDLPLEEANRVKKKHCLRNSIGEFYAEDDYLIQRKGIEKWIYHKLLGKGGCPKDWVPIYMTLGESPEGEFDIRVDIQKDAGEFRINLNELDLKTVSFTYPDSMYELEYDEMGNVIGGKRTNTPKVYMYEELLEISKKYHIFKNGSLYYIEAQVWDRERLREIWLNRT